MSKNNSIDRRKFLSSSGRTGLALGIAPVATMLTPTSAHAGFALPTGWSEIAEFDKKMTRVVEVGGIDFYTYWESKTLIMDKANTFYIAKKTWSELGDAPNSTKMYQPITETNIENVGAENEALIVRNYTGGTRHYTVTSENYTLGNKCTLGGRRLGHITSGDALRSSLETMGFKQAYIENAKMEGSTKQKIVCEGYRIEFELTEGFKNQVTDKWQYPGRYYSYGYLPKDNNGIMMSRPERSIYGYNRWRMNEAESKWNGYRNKAEAYFFRDAIYGNLAPVVNNAFLRAASAFNAIDSEVFGPRITRPPSDLRELARRTALGPLSVIAKYWPSDLGQTLMKSAIKTAFFSLQDVTESYVKYRASLDGNGDFSMVRVCVSDNEFDLPGYCEP